MIASRFWLGFLALCLGVAVVVLDLAISQHDRLSDRTVSEGLASDSRVVSWYLRNTAREGASQLIRFAADRRVARALAASNGDSGKASASTARQLRGALRQTARNMPEDQAFDAVLAVNRAGRVVAHVGFDQASSVSSLEMGGYPLVADALHGYVRDDTIMMGRLYRMVARPVEVDGGGLPVGAVVGAHLVDDAFAQRVSSISNVAVAFYADGRRQGVGAPEGFVRSGLDQIVSGLPELEEDEDYESKGRTAVHELGEGLSVVFARLPGEAWQLGSGYAVIRQATHLGGMLGVLRAADEKDKKAVGLIVVFLTVILAAGVGLFLTRWEATAPLASFREQVGALVSGKGEHLAVEKLRGPFRQVGLDLNLVLERGGGGEPPVSVALSQALGDLGDQPQMSAFGVPESSPPSAVVAASHDAPMGQGFPSALNGSNGAGASLPGGQPPALPDNDGTLVGGVGAPPLPRRQSGGKGGGLQQTALGVGMAAGSAAAAVAASPLENADTDTEPGWREVYDEFVNLKEQCGENTQGFTFERFSATLRKNRDTLMQQHGVQSVHFSAYVKQGRAALKARPVRA